MDIGLIFIIGFGCLTIGLLLGVSKEKNEQRKKERIKEEEKEKQNNNDKLLRESEEIRKKESINNIKIALTHLSLRHTIHHCEGVYAMLKSKYYFIDEGENLEKQIYALLIKDTKK